MSSKLNDGRVYVFINEVTKSGLMSFHYKRSFGSWDSTEANQCAQNGVGQAQACAVFAATGIKEMYSQSFAYATSFDIYADDLTSTTLGASAELLWSDLFECMRTLPSAGVTMVDEAYSFFFVSKNKKLYIKTNCIGNLNYVGNLKYKSLITDYWDFKASVY